MFHPQSIYSLDQADIALSRLEDGGYAMADKRRVLNCLGRALRESDCDFGSKEMTNQFEGLLERADSVLTEFDFKRELRELAGSIFRELIFNSDGPPPLSPRYKSDDSRAKPSRAQVNVINFLLAEIVRTGRMDVSVTDADYADDRGIQNPSAAEQLRDAVHKQYLFRTGSRQEGFRYSLEPWVLAHYSVRSK